MIAGIDTGILCGIVDQTAGRPDQRRRNIGDHQMDGRILGDDDNRL